MLKANAVIQALNTFSRLNFFPSLNLLCSHFQRRVCFSSWNSCFTAVVSEKAWSSRLPWLTRKVTLTCLIRAKRGEQNMAFFFILQNEKNVRLKRARTILSFTTFWCSFFKEAVSCVFCDQRKMRNAAVCQRLSSFDSVVIWINGPKNRETANATQSPPSPSRPAATTMSVQELPMTQQVLK